MNQALFAWISRCTTAYHTVQEVKRALSQDGFLPFDPAKDGVEKGGKYYYEKNGSSIFAFRIPQERPHGFLMTVLHADSPSFKLKHQALMDRGGFLCLNTERYGGMDLHSWFDRPLGIAGRVFFTENGRLECRTVDSQRPLCLIPSVAGHLMKEKSAPDPKNDLVPLFSQSGKESIWHCLNVSGREVVGSDLFLYP